MEFGVAGTEQYKKGRRSGKSPKSSGRYPRRDLHLWDVLSVRIDRCAGRGKGADEASPKPQKIVDMQKERTRMYEGNRGGSVNKIKVIKQIMYDQNSFEL